MTDKVEDKPEVKAKKADPKPEAKATGGQLVHHVIRVISQDGSGSGGSWLLADIEDYLMQYTMNGWVLEGAYPIGQLPEGFVFMWLLVKNP